MFDDETTRLFRCFADLVHERHRWDTLADMMQEEDDDIMDRLLRGFRSGIYQSAAAERERAYESGSDDDSDEADSANTEDSSTTLTERRKCIQMSGEFPACNLTAGIDPACNIGWAKGLLCDGTPFVAELTLDDKDKVLAVMMPRLETEAAPDSDTESHSLSNFTERTDKGVLHIGMLDLGQERSQRVLTEYLRALEQNGIVSFHADTVDCAAQYCRDDRGADLARVNIRLTAEEAQEAATPLEFLPFPLSGGKAQFVRCRL